MNQAMSQRITPTTAELLRWWFGPERTEARAGPGFHEAQRGAILRTIAAHEAPEVDGPWRGQAVHRVALPAGVDRMPVLLALLVWQVLNRNDARAAGIKDPRFTHHFMAVAPHLTARGRLYNALCGLPAPGDLGTRDFGTADVVRLGELLMPANRREEVHGFVRAHACSGAQAVNRPLADGVIAVTGDRLEALECLARLPDALVFDDETCPPGGAWPEDRASRTAWHRHLHQAASAPDGRCVQVVFSDPPCGR